MIESDPASPVWNEAARLAALADYEILDTPREPGFDDLTKLVARLCRAPIALVSLVAADRQWFKSNIGIDASETPLDRSVCAWAIRQPGLFVVPDLSADDRFRNNPLVVGEPRLRFYAGARLDTVDGLPLGTLCVLDYVARPAGLTDEETFALSVLSRQVMSQLELRRSVMQRDVALGEREAAEEALRKLNATLARQVSAVSSDRARVITAARRTEQDFRLLVHAVTDYATFMIDPDGNISHWNAGAERMGGYTESEVAGTHFSRLFTDEDRAAGLPAKALTVALQDGRFADEGWRVRKDGTRFWARVLLDPVRDEAGRHIGFAEVTRDISERRDAQLALDEAQAALFQAQKMEAVGQLTSGIAHDFNNLLTGILGSLDLVQTRLNQGRTDTLERYVGTAMTSAQKAAALTQRLLAFSRRQPLDPKPVDAAALIRAMEDLLRRTINKQIALLIVAAPDLWETLCDPNQLENAILNLAINARDAMPDGGTLTIDASNAELDDSYAAQNADLPSGEYVCIAVTDTGAGMSARVAQRAFEPFFTTKPAGQGTGLGLSMIYGFARQSGGHAKIASVVGRGTTVRIYLPRHMPREQVVAHHVASHGDGVPTEGHPGSAPPSETGRADIPAV